MVDNILENRIYAGFWSRLGAHAIDMLILGLISGILLALITVLVNVGEQMLALVLLFVYTVLPTILPSIIATFYAIFTIASKKQATIGQRVCNIYVITTEGQRLTKMRTLGRVMAPGIPPFLFILFVSTITFFQGGHILEALIDKTCVCVSAFLYILGFLIIAFTKEKTAFSDIICKTRVILGRPENQ